MKKLPNDLAATVNGANEENKIISGNGFKGINESIKSAERNADDGKFIPQKGKYVPANNTPGAKNPYQQ